MVFFSSSTSPLASTVIFRDRSPLATEVVTSAMLRTCAVRLLASRLTLSVRSFQVPATPGTSACAPSLPSTPTVRATLVTCCAKIDSVLVMLLSVSPSAAISPLAFTCSFSERSPSATAVTTFTMPRTWVVRFEAMKFTLSVRSFHTPDTPFTSAWPPSFPSVPTPRVAREVGAEGKLGGQADVKGVSGVWKDLTDNVNFMASNLTTQVRGIVKVVTAVANGDLSQKLGVEARGVIAALADTLNSMTKTLGIFAEQVTSVARTVGVERKLGAQASVPGVAGTWKDLTDNVNLLANNLTSQVRNIAEVMTSVANGNLSRKITVDARGEVLELKSTINTMVEQLRSFTGEVTRVARTVGVDGKLGAQAEVPGVAGTWKDLTDNVNLMASNLTSQVRNIAEVSTAVARGDLSKKITVDVKGEILELKNTINTMVDQLNSFASEVT